MVQELRIHLAKQGMQVHVDLQSGVGSHMPQGNYAHVLQQKIPHATTKTRNSQISEYFQKVVWQRW